jgi:hypothetical protein
MKRTYSDSHPPLLNPRDVDFLLYEWLDVAELCDRPRYSEHSKESFDSVLDLAADIATKRFAPHYKTADTKEPFVNPDGTVTTLPEMKAALSAVSAAGLVAGEFDHDIDGYGRCSRVAISERCATRWSDPTGRRRGSRPPAHPRELVAVPVPPERHHDRNRRRQ